VVLGLWEDGVSVWCGMQDALVASPWVPLLDRFLGWLLAAWGLVGCGGEDFGVCWVPVWLRGLTGAGVLVS
jgi:hypothetical protein